MCIAAVHNEEMLHCSNHLVQFQPKLAQWVATRLKAKPNVLFPPFADIRLRKLKLGGVRRIWRVLAVIGLGIAMALAILNGWYNG